eukprot:6362049-Alexandrium_andersonii.AAC.1
MQRVCTFLEHPRHSDPLRDALQDMRHTCIAAGDLAHPDDRAMARFNTRASPAATRLQVRVSFTYIVVRPMLTAVELQLFHSGFYAINTRQQDYGTRLGLRLLREWMQQRITIHLQQRRLPLSLLPGIAQALLQWVGQLIGNASHILTGNGGGKGGGKAAKGQEAPASSAGKGSYQPGGHNPAWQAWMPRAYQEQKQELEHYKRTEEEKKRKSAITSQIREGIGQFMDGLLGQKRRDRRGRSPSPQRSKKRKRKHSSSSRREESPHSSEDTGGKTFFSKLTRLKR